MSNYLVYMIILTYTSSFVNTNRIKYLTHRKGARNIERLIFIICLFLNLDPASNISALQTLLYDSL